MINEKKTQIIGIPKEIHNSERRVSIVPSTIGQLTKLGYKVVVEKSAGELANFPDKLYLDAGAQIENDVRNIWGKSDFIIKIRAPVKHQILGVNELDLMKKNSCLICLLNPAKNISLLKKIAKIGSTAISTDCIPRISRAQSMDVLSSMANISGYRAMVEAAHFFGRLLSGQITAAGKIPAAKVLVIGAGVAGLSAIGTAKNLGAIVRSFDTRPHVKDEVKSMGAEFLELDFPENSEGTGGYAKVMSREFIDAEMTLLDKQAQDVDIIITTASVPGKKAPILINEDMVKSMKPGSIIVDLSAENGGNCSITKKDKLIKAYGVYVIGFTDLPSRLPTQSSQLYSNNMLKLVQHLGTYKENINFNDEIIKAITIVNKGNIYWPPTNDNNFKDDEKKIKLQEKKIKVKESNVNEIRVDTDVSHKSSSLKNKFLSYLLIAFGSILLPIIGLFGSSEFLVHLTVFVLACFVGYMIVWNVTPSLHTPLMSVTNAISGIIIIGGMIHISGSFPFLSGVGVFIATINIFGGFYITRKMLEMFRK